ncbi:helix-turn-helix domain-containing protein [Intrasporangium mesophilum]
MKRSEQPQLAALAESMLDDLDELVDGATTVISREVDFYRATQVLDVADLRESVRLNMTLALTPFVTGAPSADPAAGRAIWRSRAREGVPLPALMDTIRIGSRFLWQELVGRAAQGKRVPESELLTAASELWDTQEIFTTAMVESYREARTAHVLEHEHERSALVEALLTGRIAEQETLWEVADVLGIGASGPYAVVACDLPSVGRPALAGIEAALRAVGLSSAWRLMPDLQVGLVRLDRAEHEPRLVGLLDERAVTRVGISPVFTDLRRTSDALRLARLAMAASLPRRLVTPFEADALGVTTIASPDINLRVARTVLGGLDDVADSDRRVLLDTFDTWLDCDGSASRAAQRLYVHPNTVRQRLRRLEAHTGRSLSRPRDVLELCLALETERRLGGDTAGSPGGSP